MMGNSGGTARALAVGLAGLVAGIAAAACAGHAIAETWPDLADWHLSIAPDGPATTQPSARAAPAPSASLPGGETSVMGALGRDAFSQPAANLDPARLQAFRDGNVLFRKLWVAAPSFIAGSDGLGPLYNARSCEACHRRDGRGRATGTSDAGPGLMAKLARPGGAGQDAIPGYHATLPDPVIGGQLQDHAAPGLTAEGGLDLAHDPLPVALADGTVIFLQQPRYRLTGPAADLPPGLLQSVRMAPPMIGLGLIEAIPVAQILAHADPGDRDGDGISGRPNIVLSAEFARPMLGRFGWKAGQPTVRAQTAHALAADMGLSNPLAPQPWGECTRTQADCRSAPDGADAQAGEIFEVGSDGLDLLTHYARNLAVPARPGHDRPEVLAGGQVFGDAGCPVCHVPAYTTARLSDRPEQSDQTIWPYSDFLLHDMGAGLADSYPEALAEGHEWRTPPLWGLGRARDVNDRPGFLHDGRARTILEAILWHAGEATRARDRVLQLSATDRRRLLDFLESL